MALRLPTAAMFEEDYCWLLFLTMMGLAGVYDIECWTEAEGVSVGGKSFVW